MERLGITTSEAAEYLGCSPAALRRWRKTECGPRFYRAGRLVRYQRKDLDDWVRHHSSSGESTPNHSQLPEDIGR
jgi:excisionase family DNA binding protein